MRPSIPLKLLLLFALTVSSAGTFAAASGERPRLESYPSSYEFLQALQAWNQAHADAAAKPVVAVAAQQEIATPAPAVATIDPTSELAPPPIEITGPENLDHAVEQARSITHPNYKEKIRYHRSTHISFPLHSIDGQDMSQASVTDALNIQGKTVEEKKAALERLTSLLDQGLSSQQDMAKEVGAAITTAPPTTGVNESMMPAGPQGRVDVISVTGR